MELVLRHSCTQETGVGGITSLKFKNLHEEYYLQYHHEFIVLLWKSRTLFVIALQYGTTINWLYVLHLLLDLFFSISMLVCSLTALYFWSVSVSTSVVSSRAVTKSVSRDKVGSISCLELDHVLFGICHIQFAAQSTWAGKSGTKYK